MHIIQLSYVLQSLFSQQEAHFINWWDSLDANKSICWVTTLCYIFSKVLGLSFHSEESILFTKSHVVLHNSIYQADTPLLLGCFQLIKTSKFPWKFLSVVTSEFFPSSEDISRQIYYLPGGAVLYFCFFCESQYGQLNCFQSQNSFSYCIKYQLFSDNSRKVPNLFWMHPSAESFVLQLNQWPFF